MILTLQDMSAIIYKREIPSLHFGTECELKSHEALIQLVLTNSTLGSRKMLETEGTVQKV